MIKHPESQLDMYTTDEVATLLGMSLTEFGTYFDKHKPEFVDGEDYATLTVEGNAGPELYFFADALPKLIDASE